jgi:hypothetical protein
LPVRSDWSRWRFLLLPWGFSLCLSGGRVGFQWLFLEGVASVRGVGVAGEVDHDVTRGGFGEGTGAARGGA